MKAKNVLHLVEYLYLGGIERLLEQLSANNSANTNLHFYTYETTELRGIGRQIRERGLKVFTYKKAKGTDFQLLKDLIKVIKENNIEVVHTHDFGPIEYAVLLKLRFPKLKLIHTQHTLVHFLNKRHYRWFFQVASYFYSSVVGVSKYVSDRIRVECPLTNRFALTVVYNGVDTNIFKRTIIDYDRTKLNLVAIARISNEKNLKYLFNTCKKLKEHNIPFIFHHAGTGKTKEIVDDFHDFIETNNLTDSVIMHGYVDDAKSILDLGDIFLSSSLTEGHPVSVIEAMACEKLIFCSDILPHIETAQGKINLYDVNDPDALFNLLVEVYKNKINTIENRPELRELVVKEYSIERMVEDYGKLYQ